MIVQKLRFKFENQSYTWTGHTWYRTDAPGLELSDQLVRRLNEVARVYLQRADDQITDPDELLERAKSARDTKDLDRGERNARRAYQMCPDNPGTLAVLCSILRDKHLPDQALKEAAVYRTFYPPLVTCRAAALCDLARWEEAKRVIGQVLVMGGSEEAFNVVKRIKQARPDLYH